MKNLCITLLILLFCIKNAGADCVFPENYDPVIKIKVKSCREIAPNTDEKIKKYSAAGEYNHLHSEDLLNKYYTGAVIESNAGYFYIYPSQNMNICNKFKKGAIVEKKVHSVCCDTGEWGKCIYGGSYITEIDQELNVFQ